MKKTARHEIVWTRVPPTNGPRIAVAAAAAAQIPIALPRSGPSNVCVSKASEPGTSNAPAAPWTTRNAISVSMFGAKPHKMDAAPKPTSPMTKKRRRPNASARAPASISSALRLSR